MVSKDGSHVYFVFAGGLSVWRISRTSISLYKGALPGLLRNQDALVPGTPTVQDVYEWEGHGGISSQRMAAALPDLLGSAHRYI